MSRNETLLENVSLRLGRFSLRDIGFSVAGGESLAILGPNGAGKSVTLETIAGFHRPHAGRIVIAGADVTELPPERRGVALVFQNYGLFPHLTVAENVAFSRGARGNWSRGRRSMSVAEALARFGITHLADRRPYDLSPGEKQRTALARALIREPGLFLFDEPFAALDQRTRDDLREELGAFLRATRIPAIFVTHDQVDATVLANRVAIMNNGAIVQMGAVTDVLQAPADSFVADFLGIENRLPARVVGRTGPLWQVAVGERRLHVHGNAAAATGGEVFLCIRGVDVVLDHAAAAIGKTCASENGINRLTMRVVRVIGLGVLCRVLLEGSFPLTACLTERARRELGLVAGSDAVVEIAPETIHMLAAS